MVSEQSIDYEKLARESLRNVIRASLEQAIDGLPGNHHFFITIQTGAPGVEISEGLRAAYPEEITIVIQHQFLDLFVEPDRFSVTLFFANTPERLTVPYKAVSRFYDPSVPFGLIFEVDLDTKLQSTADLEAVPALVEEIIDDIAEENALAEASEEEDAPESEEEVDDASLEEAEEPAGATVVSLDQFRKR